MSKKLFTFIVLSLVTSFQNLHGQTVVDFFDDSVVHDIRLTLKAEDWETLKEDYLENTYYKGDMQWRGIKVPNIGIRSRGGGTRNGTKPGLKLDMNEFDSKQDFLGLTAVVLDNAWQDPSYMREKIALKFYAQMGIPTPREAFARLFINGVYSGLYIMVEEIDKKFLARAFGEDQGYLYEYDWLSIYKFEYLGANTALYSPAPFKPQTNEKTPDLAPLEAFIRTIHQGNSDADWQLQVGKYTDLKQLMRYAATENFTADPDGFLGYAGVNNFYMYRAKDSTLFKFIPWDKDVSFSPADNPYALPIDGYRSSIYRNVNEIVMVRRAMNIPELKQVFNTAASDLAAFSLTFLEKEINRNEALIRMAALEDPFRQFADFQRSVAYLREFAQSRSPLVVAEVRGVPVPPLTGLRPQVESSGIVNAASGKSQLAPGAIGTIFGERLAKATVTATTTPLPTTLGGVSVTVRGVAAPLYYVSANQLNFQVPWSIPAGPAAVQVTVDGVKSNSVAASFLATSPGIFAVTHTSGARVSIDNPAKPSEILVGYATGFGAVRPTVGVGVSTPVSPLIRTNLSPILTIDGLSAEVLYSGLTPSLVGVNQVNFRIPANAKIGNAQVLLVTIGGQSSQNVTLAIR